MPRKPKGQGKPIAKTSARMSRKAALTPAQLEQLDAYWRASNYLSACQLYLLDNPLLKQPLQPEHIKKKIVGHWGTVPGQNFIYTHLNRIITKWKDQLETQYLYISQATSGYGRAYICSPCTAGTAKGVQRNVQAARFYMWYAFENMEVIARAPHAYLPILLSDKLPAERALALRFGLELLEQSDMVFVCGKLLSTGMKGEIIRAAELSIPIIVYDAELYLKVRKLVTRYGGDKAQVKLHNEPCYLSLTAEEILA